MASPSLADGIRSIFRRKGLFQLPRAHMAVLGSNPCHRPIPSQLRSIFRRILARGQEEESSPFLFSAPLSHGITCAVSFSSDVSSFVSLSSG